MSKFRSKPLALLLAIVTGCCALPALDSRSHEVAENRLFQARFDQCVRFIDFFQGQHDRLPTPEEYKQWSYNKLPCIPDTLDGFVGQSVEYQTWANSPPDLHPDVAEFGKPPPNSYLLSIWRGEWEEFYAAWAKRSSLPLSADDYYMFGSRMAELSLILLMGVGAWWLWPKRTS